METLFTLIGITATLVTIALASSGIAYILTEVWPLPIKRKPFNCYGCLSFWLTFISGLGVAFVARRYFETGEAKEVATYGVALVSLLLGLLNYLYVKSKFKIYD